jgi:hypothetical protein
MRKGPIPMPTFQQQLQEQIGFLDASCAAYDYGNKSEALRLATTIRVLVHDTSNSTSLLKHLGVKETMEMIDGSGFGFDNLPPIGPNPTTSSCTLIAVAHFDDHVEYHPAFVCDPIDMEKAVPFETWWKTFITHDSENRRMNRPAFDAAVFLEKDGNCAQEVSCRSS